jgi:folate-binding protein YgfZ
VSVRCFTLSGRGVVAVRGEDRRRWLDGMLTCDVKRLTPGAGAHGLLLTPQGRIVAEVHVLHRGEELWLETEAAVIPGAIARLERFVIADDVALVDRTPELARLALEGDGAAELAASLDAAAPQSAHGVADATLAGEPVALARYGFTAADALQLFVPRAAESAVVAALLAAGAARGSAEELECARIEAGVPWPSRELDESVLPAEARLDGVAVALAKGCYTGQEVVARMRSRKRAAQLLVGLRFSGTALPAPRSVLIGERGAVGSVTSSVRSPRYGAIGLGYVQAALAEPGAVFRVEGAARSEAAPSGAREGVALAEPEPRADGVQAHVVALPFTADAARAAS